MRIMIVRHGETKHNRDEIITGQIDVVLNSKGEKQAGKVAERLENEQFQAAYSSDLKRSYKTTQIIADKHDISAITSEKLRERSFGKYEGKKQDFWRNVITDKIDERHKLRPENGETLEEVGKRMVDYFNIIQEKHEEGEKILVGSHNASIKAAILEILGLDGSYYGKLSQHNTAITEIEHDDSFGWKIIRMNDTAHLSS